MKAEIVAVGIVLCCAHAVVAQAAERFVSKAGSDAGNDCASAVAPCATLTHALGQAASGDTIAMVGGLGIYAEAPAVAPSQVVAISGGWSRDFASRDLTKYPTTLTGDSFTIAAGAGESVDVTLDGLRFSRTPVLVTGMDDGALSVSVTDCRFSGLGGIDAVHEGSGTIDLAVTGSTFTGDRYPRAAIEVFAEAGPSTVNLDVETSAFTNNHFGAIAVQDDLQGSASLSVARSTFIGNKAIEGGAIFVGGYGAATTVTVTNTYLSRNTTTRGPFSAVEAYPELYGGAVAVDGTSATTATFVNDTIVRNRGRAGSGIFANGGPTVNVTNTILWDNHGDDLFADTTDFAAPGPVVNADHDDLHLTGAAHGTFNDLGGNLIVDPELVRGFGLGVSSPMIDAGTCTGAPPTDLDGNPRPSGAGCDIGADEFVE